MKYDSDAASSFYLDVAGAVIDLQFPPKIMSENKRTQWQEDMQMGVEEFATYRGSWAKQLQIELNFVVWGKWTQEKIRTTIRDVKKILYTPGGESTYGPKLPFITIGGWKVIPGAGGVKQKFRLMGVNIVYSREYVGSGNDYWPLHTKLDMTCKLLTVVGAISGFKALQETDFGDYGVLQNGVPPDWF